MRASLDGILEGQLLSFTKTYDPLGTYAHAVHYEGMMNPKCTAITGSWSIRDYSGKFEMYREDFEDEIENEEITSLVVASGSPLSRG